MPIAAYFSLYNEYARSPGEDWKMQYVYDALTTRGAKASACLGCGACERRCPQMIRIPETLGKLAKVFE